MSRRRNHTNEHKVSLAVLERAREIFHRNYDAYKRIVHTNAAIADMLGISERSVVNANHEPLSTSGWTALVLMAQLELEKEKDKAYEEYRREHQKV